MTSHPILLAILGGFLANDPASSTRPSEPLLVPRIDGTPWVVVRDPDLGELTSPKQQPVDFAVWPAKDGIWQLWSCIRGTKCGGNGRLFHRWEGRKLTDPDWEPVGIAWQARPELGETPGGLQAPFVLPSSSDYPAYLMFYGDWVHICIGACRDGKTFLPWPLHKDAKSPALFSEGPEDNTRDPMVIKIKGLWHCYYTAMPKGRGSVYCRTSRNLSDWSDPTIVSTGGKGGTAPTSAECPFVVFRGGYYYLFRTQRYGQDAATHVYRSKDPMQFNLDNDRGYVCTLPVAAPEIIAHDGRDYIAFLLPTLKGIQISKLVWEPNLASRETQ